MYVLFLLLFFIINSMEHSSFIHNSEGRMIISDSGSRFIFVANLNGSNPNLLLYLPSSVPGVKYCSFIIISILFYPSINFYFMQIQ